MNLCGVNCITLRTPWACSRRETLISALAAQDNKERAPQDLQHGETFALPGQSHHITINYSVFASLQQSSATPADSSMKG